MNCFLFHFSLLGECHSVVHFKCRRECTRPHQTNSFPFLLLLLRCYYYVTFKHTLLLNLIRTPATTTAKHKTKYKQKTKQNIKIGERTTHNLFSSIIIMELFVFYFAAWMVAHLISFSMALFHSIWLRMGSPVRHAAHVQLMCSNDGQNAFSACVNFIIVGGMRWTHINIQTVFSCTRHTRHSGRDLRAFTLFSKNLTATPPFNRIYFMALRFLFRLVRRSFLVKNFIYGRKGTL